jgi:glutathionylspermidine synthase
VERVAHSPRPDWRAQVEAQGLVWHSHEPDADGSPNAAPPNAAPPGAAQAAGRPYWTEDAHYELTLAEAEAVEAATHELHARCLDAVQHVIDRDRFTELAIPREAVPLICDSWEEDPPSLYGRFDLAYDGRGGPPKLLEYNADTPTSLVEASLVQWEWLQQFEPAADQFNSLHDRLVAAWRSFGPHLGGAPVHFYAVAEPEDAMTVEYLRDTAVQAGLDTRLGTLDQIGLRADGWFVDADDRPIVNCFKLYPWEWLVREDYGPPLLALGTRIRWVEPAWKMVLSNKGILAVLWELFPDHPNLLAASFDPLDRQLVDAHVRKPLLSREGAGVTVSLFGEVLAARDSAGYGAEGYVYQALATLPDYEGRRPVLGSWVVGQEPAGLGIREAPGLITDNRSSFVPHLIRG